MRIPNLTEPPPEEVAVVTVLDNATEEEAGLQGEWAYTFGREPEANPYPEGSDEYDWWETGYWFAADECEG